PPHAHNVIMQSLVTTGAIGTAILLIPLLYTVMHMLRSANSDVNPFVCYTIVLGMVGLGPIGGTPETLTLIWMLSLFLIRSGIVAEASDTHGWTRSRPASGASVIYPPLRGMTGEN